MFFPTKKRESAFSRQVPRFERAAAGLFAALIASAGCGGAIGQHEKSGPDYEPEGAAPVEVEDGEGSAVDIVTYPGGDRVDWKKVELPEDFAGVLQVRLLFKPPREGLDVAFEVYDGRFEKVAESDPPPGSGTRVVEAEVEPAFGGTYYVHVFAPERTDAGEYMLAVRHRDADVTAEAEDEGGAEPRIPNPPTLPAVPEGGEVASQTGGGQDSGSSSGGGSPPPAPDPDADEEDDDAEAAEPVEARVVSYQLAGGGLVLRVNRGTNDGVERGWTGQLMMGSSGRPLRGGSFTVTRVTSGEAVGEAKVSVDQIRANRRVVLAPPGHDGEEE